MPTPPLLTPTDWVLVGGAVVVCLVVGWVAGRGVDSAEEFHTGGRRFSAWAVACSVAVTLASGLLWVGGAGGVAHRSVAAVRPLLLGWVWLPLLCLLWAPVLQRQRITTAPEYLGRRFSPAVRRTSAVLSLLLLLALLALELAVLGATFRALTGGPALAFAAAAAAVATAYAAWGGQRSAVVTNVVQALLLAVGATVLLWGVSGVTELRGLLQSAPLSQRSLVPEPLTVGPWRTVARLVTDAWVISAVGLIASQALCGRLVAARGERAAARGALLGVGPLLIAAVVAVVFVGLAHSLLVDLARLPTGEPEPLALASVMAAVSSPGGLGLVAAALLVAVLSTVDGLLLGVSAVVSVDLRSAGGREDRPRSLALGRWTVLATAGVGVGLSALFDGLGDLAGLGGLFGATLGAPLAVVLTAGLISRRVSAAAALVALGVGVVGGAVSTVWITGPFVSGADVTRAGLAAGGSALLVTLGGWLWALRGKAPQPEGLTWRTLAPAWPRRRVEVGIEPSKRLASSKDAAELPEVRLPAAALEALELSAGHEVHLTATRRSWLGLRSFRARVQKARASSDRVEAPPDAMKQAGLRASDRVTVVRVA